MEHNIIIRKKCDDCFDKFFSREKIINKEDIKKTIDLFEDLMIQIYKNFNLNINNMSDINLITINDYYEILLMFFPYIDTNENNEKLKKLKNISDMKEIFTDTDISNYSINNKNLNDHSYIDIIYNKCQSLYKIFILYKNSFYVNWYTIFPVLFREEYERKIKLLYYEDEDIKILDNIKKLYFNKNNILYHFKPFDDIYYENGEFIYDHTYSPKFINELINYLNQINYEDVIKNYMLAYENNINNEQFLNKLYRLKDNKLISLIVIYKFLTGTLSKVILREEDKPNLKDPNILNKYDKCYHYLKNMTYKDLKKRNKKMFDETIKNFIENDNKLLIEKYKQEIEFNDFQFGDLKTNRDIYSVRWVAQLKLFYTYFNTNIMFITGGTGVGKSTQIPKLLSYLSILSGNLNGRTVCTEPRRNAVQNMEYISKQMGIILPNNRADNNLQYYTSQDKFKSKENYNTPLFKMTTDGALYNEIIRNGKTFLLEDKLIKEEIINICQSKLIKDLNIDYESLTIYEILKYIESSKELNYLSFFYLYHIIIIDEVHEHNENIDYLLTILNELIKKYEFKLILISATLESDEKHFREFFNFNNYYFIDNRCHFSELFKTTTYNIEEKYDNELINFQMIQEHEKNKKIVKIINDLKGNYSNILIFKMGRNEIMQCGWYLYTHLKIKNVIPLPYFRDLNEVYKREIINDTNHNLKLDIEKIYIDWDFELNNHFNSSKSRRYEHYIFISTNIAEASITIDPLSVVIDDGLQKRTKFNYLYLSNTDLLPEPIAETNRIQRKGRVGRKEDGKAFFLYPKNALININSYYSLSNNDIRPFILKILNTENIFYDEINDNNIIIPFQKLLDKDNNFYLEHPFKYLFNQKNYYKFMVFIMQSYIDFNLIKPFNNEFIKSEFGSVISDLSTQLILSIEYILCIINAYPLNCVDLMISFLCIFDNKNMCIHFINKQFQHKILKDSDYLNAIKHLNKVEKIIFKKSLSNYLIDKLNNIKVDLNKSSIKKYNQIRDKINKIVDENEIKKLINNVIHEGNFNFNLFNFYWNFSMKENFILFCIQYFKLKSDILIIFLLSFQTIDNINFVNNDLLNDKKINFDLNSLKSFIPYEIFPLDNYNKISFLLIKYLYQYIYINIPNDDIRLNIYNLTSYVNIFSFNKILQYKIRYFPRAINEDWNANSSPKYASISLSNNSLFIITNTIVQNKVLKDMNNLIKKPTPDDFIYIESYYYKHNLNPNLLKYIPKYYHIFFENFITIPKDKKIRIDTKEKEEIINTIYDFI